jgi:hypothetical protein
MVGWILIGKSKSPKGAIVVVKLKLGQVAVLVCFIAHEAANDNAQKSAA